ncbi:MAG: hypothetical protein KIT69_00070 [Propionibacteriaceae bacterium]|nr:hypothetical protein [Propionibacteriaceae bacterium]
MAAQAAGQQHHSHCRRWLRVNIRPFFPTPPARHGDPAGARRTPPPDPVARAQVRDLVRRQADRPPGGRLLQQRGRRCRTTSLSTGSGAVARGIPGHYGRATTECAAGSFRLWKTSPPRSLSTALTR